MTTLPAAAVPQFVPDPLVVSASRLTLLGGEKGKPGCERSYLGAYGYGMKQGGSTATEFGSALHLRAEIYQETGELLEPESRVSTVLSSGIHLLDPYNEALVTSGPAWRLLIEWEHWGYLPPLADGTTPEFIAYLDGGSPDGGSTSTVVIQDLKTTSDRKYALNTDPKSDYWLGKNKQAMFYAAILMLLPHMCCPPLPDGHYGPKHWRSWDPVDRNTNKNARLRWLYFLTRGSEHAWDVSVHVTRAEVQSFLDETIMPLVEKMTALHHWRERNPSASLDEIDRNLSRCTMRGSAGHWCGVGEHKACNYAALGTPIQLLQLGKTRPAMSSETANDRLAALRARRTGATPAPLTITPPPAPEAAPASPPAQTGPSIAPAPSVSGTDASPSAILVVETAESSASATTSALAVTGTDAVPASTGKARGRPRAQKAAAPPSAPPVSPGINPPEAVAALAKLTTESTAAQPGTVPLTSTTEVDGRTLQLSGAVLLSAVPLEALLGEVFRRVLVNTGVQS